MRRINKPIKILLLLFVIITGVIILFYLYKGNPNIKLFQYTLGEIQLTQKEIAEKYAQSIILLDFETAKKYSTEENCQYLDSIKNVLNEIKNKENSNYYSIITRAKTYENYKKIETQRIGSNFGAYSQYSVKFTSEIYGKSIKFYVYLLSDKVYKADYDFDFSIDFRIKDLQQFRKEKNDVWEKHKQNKEGETLNIRDSKEN
jgi:hypothetical protein